MSEHETVRPSRTGRRKFINVMIADDHPLIIEGLAAALSDFGVKVVARTQEDRSVVSLYGETTPDVLLLDLRFGDDSSGLNVARSLLKKFPLARIVIFSQFDQDAVLREAYQIGVMAFVTKQADPLVLVEAIRRASIGKPYFMPEIAERLALLSVRGDDSPQGRLGPRELEVFKLMAEGRTNVEMAELLNLSPKTISITSQSIKEQLGMHRAAEITLLAVRHGLIQF